MASRVTPIRGMDGAHFAEITRLATKQHGLIELGQLAELSVGRGQLRALVDRGSLTLVAPRVYGITGIPDSVGRALRLGLLSLGPTAAVSHEAAARLHDFDRALPNAVEFTVRRDDRRSESPFRIHTTRVLPEIDVVTVAGYRCTSATRTVIDLARARISRYRLEAAIDSAVRTGASSPTVLVERLTALRGRGRWGVRLLDRLLLDTGGHTMLERRFLALMRESGLPRPTPQVLHRREGRAYARVDFCFDAHDLVIEVSGRKGHSSPAERARDAQRRNELQDAGRKVYEYTWEDVTERPGFVARSMRERLRDAGWHP